MNEPKIRVVVFDDHPSLRENMEMLIDAQDDMICLGCYPDCNEIENVIRKMNADVVLMDIQMPGMNGIEGVKKIKKLFPEKKILMQTVFEDEQKVFDSICAGASGYILKRSSSEEIVKAIRDTYAGGSAMTPAIAVKVLEKFRGSFSSPDTNDAAVLSERERQILILLSAGKSYKMIANELGISFYTVDSHLRKVYEKLHVHSMTEAVDQARKRHLLP